MGQIGSLKVERASEFVDVLRRFVKAGGSPLFVVVSLHEAADSRITAAYARVMLPGMSNVLSGRQWVTPPTLMEYSLAGTPDGRRYLDVIRKACMDELDIPVVDGSLAVL